MEAFSKPLRSTAPARVNQTVFLGTIWGGVSVSLVFVGIRLYARWRSFRKLFFDDAFVVFAWLLALFNAVHWQVVSRFMYEILSVTSGQVFPPPPTFITDSEKYYKGSVIVLVFFYSGLWAVKFSFLLFFRRLAANVSGQNILWWSVFAVTLATYFVCIGTIQYKCLAAPLLDIIKNCSNAGAINFQLATLKFNCAADFVTDYLSRSTDKQGNTALTQS
ncbi:MAG: hypothetical protein M1828_006525 [Chrysothrix sp. TS-e1954]|nr:MAG: hypothetical protein M1828_006525 [Chrysothrix sp. TS-e1954]